MTSNLTSYEAFQLERFGDILPADRILTHEEYENNAAQAEAFAERVAAHFELELLHQ